MLKDEDSLVKYLSQFEGPFKIYRNPMRDDGVFVAQDVPLEPYPGGGFPAVPFKAEGLGYQIPKELAERVVARLNAR